MAEELHYKITGDASELKKSLHESFEGAKKLGESIKGVAEAIGVIFLAEKAFEFLKDSLAESFKAFRENESAAHALGTIIGQNSKAFEEFKKINEELEGKGTFSETELLKAEALGRAFGLTNQQMQKIIPATADIAAGLREMGKDVSLDQVQKEIDKYIKTGKSRLLESAGVRGGNTQAEREKLVENSQFKGANAGALDTTEGKIKNLKNNLESIQITVGSYIASAFDKVFPYIQKLLEGVKDFFKEIESNKDKIKNMITEWYNIFYPLIELFRKAFGGLGDFLKPFNDLFKTSISQYKEQVKGIIDDIVKLATPVMEVVEFVRPFLIEFIERLQVFGKIVFDVFQKIFNIGYSIYQILDKLGVFKAIGALFKSIWETVKTVFDAMVWAYNNIISPILDKIQKALDYVKRLQGIKIEVTANGEGIKSPWDEKKEQKDEKEGKDTGKEKNNAGLPEAPSKSESTRESITLNITKLVETLEIKTTNLTESTAEIKQKIAEALQEAVLSVKYTN